jgi:hypothetical protein
MLPAGTITSMISPTLSVRLVSTSIFLGLIGMLLLASFYMSHRSVFPDPNFYPNLKTAGELNRAAEWVIVAYALFSLGWWVKLRAKRM